MTDKNEMAKEGGHYYNYDGSTAYEVPYADKSKGMRKTTLRDAKKLNLYPSVTTVLNVLAKPGLERWKQNNLLMSALTLPHIDGESLDDYAKRVTVDAADQAKAAAERGTYIHGSLEKYYVTGQVVDEHAAIIEGVSAAMLEVFGPQNWCAEKSFTCLDLGYGGKIDLHSDEWIVDFKTKEFGPDDKVIGYDEQAIQLAAYRRGLDKPNAKLANVFVSVTHPGLVKIHVWDEERDYLQPFILTLALWQWQKQYHPKGSL
jgi:hypothetical protein